MDFLIVSDTHGRRDRLAEVLERSPADILLFLGDGLRDLDLVPDDYTLRAVRGNCDFFSAADTPEERVEQFGATRIFMTHGHRYGVKGGLGAVLSAAVRQNADVLLYGHTHVPQSFTLAAGEQVGDRCLQKPLLVICPGSLGDPRDGKPSFATLTVRENGMLAGFGSL